MHWISNSVKNTLALVFENSRWDSTKDIISVFSQPLILVFLSIVFITNIIYIESALLHTTVFSSVVYFILYSKESYPIVLSLLVSPAALFIFRHSDLVGVASFALIIFYFIYYHVQSGTQSVLMWISNFVFLLGVFIHTVFMYPLVGVDERDFYSRVADFESSSAYLQYLYDILLNDPTRLQNSIETFAIIYLPFYDLFEISSPRLIIILNIALWILTALLFRELLVAYSDRTGDVSPNVVFAVLLLSPTAVYWSSTFAKDITSTFLCMTAAYLFFRKKVLFFIIVFIFSMMIRPYSVVIISIYISIVMWSQLLFAVGVVLSLIIVLLLTGEPISLVNSLLVFGYLFISPNPIRLANWTSLEILPRTIEGLVYGVVLAISVLYSVVDRHIRRQYILLGSALATFSLVLILIGYTLTYSDSPYSIGSVGTNALRRMIPMLPVIALWVSVTISHTKIPKIAIKK